MRKDQHDISDTSSSLVLNQDQKSTAKAEQKSLAAIKSKLEINMEVLLGDLSEIKAENGLIDNQDNFQTMLEPYQPK